MPSSARIRSWLPLAVLLVALAAAFVIIGPKGHFYKSGGLHDYSSAQTLAAVGNLSPKHNFKLAKTIWEREDGSFRYNLYSRFPVGGYALLKLAIMPFGSDLSAQMVAARSLMLLMFCGAAIFAYLALARIAGSRWIALAAALLAFSSFYPLYFADGVFNEGVMDLFGAMLVFHGMVLFIQEGRFRQLLLKTCAALLMGWHVYALIMPFALMGFGGEALARVRAALASGGGIRAARAALPALARSRFIALAAVAVLFGSALLAFNALNDFDAYGNRRALSELPVLDAAMRRLGMRAVSEEGAGAVFNAEWGDFLKRQLHRAGAMATPYALAREFGQGFAGGDEPDADELSPALIVWGVAAACAALAALALVRRGRRILFASAVLYGFCWSLALRHTVDKLHHYETLPYIGMSLALFALALMGARAALGERLGERLAIGLSAFAALAFAVSAMQMESIGRGDAETEENRAMISDFSAIGEIARGKRVLVAASPESLAGGGGARLDRQMIANWHMAGMYSRRVGSCEGEPPETADFVISRYRFDGFNPLTPENRFVFLYGPDVVPLELCRAERRRLESLEPDARGEYDVYLDRESNSIGFLKASCAPEDYENPFFVYIYPESADDLGAERRAAGFEALGERARFHEFGARFDGACLMTAHHPFHYPISRIQTGQHISGGARLWEVSVFPPPSAERIAAYEREYQAISSREPAARSGGFDLHLTENAIIYLKQPCSQADVRGRFWLSVHPADAGDLPAERREIGHESLNFDFEPPIGAAFNGKCMATRQLPDYEIIKIETGQDAPGGGRIWDAVVEVGD